MEQYYIYLKNKSLDRIAKFVFFLTLNVDI